MSLNKSKIAIIGTGMTALSIGYHLPSLYPSIEITYFDKGLKPGGRLATRRTRKNKELLFDHGAPYFTQKDLKGGNLFSLLSNDLKIIKPVELNFIKPNQISRIEQPKQNIATKQVYISPNGLDTVPQTIFNLLKQKNLISNSFFQQRVTQIQISKSSTSQQSLFSLKATDQKSKQIKQYGKFNKVICCIPYPQAIAIKHNIPELQKIQKLPVKYNANWIVLISVPKGSLFKNMKQSDVIDFSSCQNSPIKYAVKQNKKFDQLKGSQNQNWVIYLSNQWTQQHLNLSKDQIQKLFLSQVIKTYQQQDLKPNSITIHRWLYSRPQTNTFQQPQIFQDNNIVFAGDWIGGKQYVGQCWSLGQTVVKSMYQNDLKRQQKSKL